MLESKELLLRVVESIVAFDSLLLWKSPVFLRLSLFEVNLCVADCLETPKKLVYCVREGGDKEDIKGEGRAEVVE